jgi:hypothetical protein
VEVNEVSAGTRLNLKGRLSFSLEGRYQFLRYGLPVNPAFFGADPATITRRRDNDILVDATIPPLYMHATILKN